MLQKKSYLTPAQICEALETTAIKLSDTKSNETGSGLVDALAVIEEIENYEHIISVNENIARNNVSIYPNPTNDNLHIETEADIEEIIIFDVYGRRQDVSYQLSAVNSIDVSKLNSGVYFINIKTANENIVNRFIKK